MIAHSGLRVPTLVFAASLLFAAGCAAGSIGPNPGSGGSAYGADPDGGDHECDRDVDCGSYVCRPVEGVRRCVEPGWDGPRGDGTSCGECPAPGECRMSRCVQPDPDGAVCEFDDECLGDLCIAGHCSPDPRGDACTTAVDCPVGLACVAGMCGATPTGCVADVDCSGDFLCEAGACIPTAACMITNPDLTGTWSMGSVLRFREALPDWLGSFLDAVSGPFRFIAGDSASLDTGLPGFLESALESALRSFADTYLPPWARDLLGAIADLNDILSTWRVAETMTLTPSTELDHYRGTHVWNEVSFEYRGMRVRGRAEEIIDFSFEPDEFAANAVCGRFLIHRHDLDVSIGAIIAWIVNTVVYEATDGRYRTLEEALAAASGGFCSGAASAAESALEYPGVRIAVESACDAELTRLTGLLVAAVNDARLGLSVITLKGSSPIVSGRELAPGAWQGTLVGREFSGDFEATR